MSEYCNLKSARRFNVPQPRLNLVSPYPYYTKEQLDMRRKAEILKYKAVDQNTKTNDLTKNQKWANLAKGRNMSQYSQSLDSKYARCPSDVTLPTLTTACDVPGPPMYLYNDPNVPLYNYLTHNASYDRSTFSNDLWNLYTINQLLYLESQSATISSMAKMDTYKTEVELGVIKISDLNQNFTNSYNISTPIGIWLTGIYIGTGFDPNTLTYARPSIPSFTVKITSVKINVYYDGEIVKPITNADNINAADFSEIKVDISNTNAQIFYTVQYAGMLNIKNLTLLTNSNSIYDIKMEFEYKILDLNEPYPINSPGLYLKAGIFANLTKDNINYIANPLTNSVMLSGVPIRDLVTNTGNSIYESGSFSQFTPALM